MPSRAFTLSKTRLQSNKLTRTLRSNFSAQPDVRSAAVLGNKLIAVGGSLYDSTVGSDSIGEAVAVVNVGDQRRRCMRHRAAVQRLCL